MIEPFIATFTGGKFYPMGPDCERLNIVDIAHALSRICRYNGQVTRFWSVAAHSLAMVKRLYLEGHDASVQAAALVHDASEAYLMDVPKPIKGLFLNYKEWESNLELVIAKKYGVEFPWPSVVKHHDKAILIDEIYNFHRPDSEAWIRWGLNEDGNRGREELHPLAPAVAERTYLMEARRLLVLDAAERAWLNGRIQVLNSDIAEGDVL